MQILPKKQVRISNQNKPNHPKNQEKKSLHYNVLWNFVIKHLGS
jgi:hypothetical protein